MTITQDASLQSDFMKRAKANEVPVARLIGFETETIGTGRARSRWLLDSSTQIPWERCMAAFSATLRMPQWEWRLLALWR
jgi:hypothetical protein